MTAFTYEGFSGTDTATGVIDAPDIEGAKDLLRSQGILVSTVAPVRKKGTNREISFRKTLKLSEAAWIARQLSVMTGAGMPLPRALGMLASQREGKKSGTVLTDIQRQIVDGHSVSTAFSSHATELGSLFVALIETGEKTGHLAKSLTHLASLLERRNRLRKKVKAALTYPVGVVSTALGIALAMILFVIPLFKGFYKELGGRLPLPTRILIAVSHLLLTNLWMLPVSIIGLVAGWRQLRKSHVWHKRIDMLFLRIPIIGGLLEKAALARIASTLSTTLGVGVHLIEALEHAAASAGNLVFADALKDAAADVTGGSSLSSALAAQPGLPEVLSQMAIVGEESGAINDILARYSEQIDYEVDITADGLTSAMEPILVVFVGGIVGSILISLYLPMFDIINLVGGQKP